MTSHEPSATRSADPTALLWAPPTPRKRGPKPKFTLDGIATVAMRIADNDGLDAVTMQRVAEELGTTKMALYRYVTGRSELDAVLLDRALGAPPDFPHGDWRSALTGWAFEIHRRSVTHPWSVELAQRPHTPGPNELAWYEQGLAAVADLPLHGGEKLDVLALLVGHVLSIAQRDATSSAPEEDIASRLAPVLADRATDFPRTVAAFTEAGQEGDRGVALPFGVERIIAGIAVLVTERDASS